MTGKIFGIKEIKEILPYRYPMLMLDRAVAESDRKYIGVKNISMNELFFQGHFPNHPIMPGVLQVEAMKQLAQIAAREKLDPAGENDIYMKVLERVKFRKPNFPGDRLKIEVEVESVGDAEAVATASASNSSGLTCQAKITLGARPRQCPDAMPQLFNEYDKSVGTAKDINEIMSIAPHRYPFLLIDNIVKIEGDHIIAIKNTTANEEIYCGYAPDYAVMPESLQCEIIAQAGCACVLSRPENKGKLGYFMSIDRAEAFHPIFPGDQMVCELDIPPGQSRFGKGAGNIKVGGKVVFAITLMFAIVDPS